MYDPGHQLTLTSNAFMFPVVYFFFPETRLRSLEEMDMIFKKSHSIFDVTAISLKEPLRHDKFGNLKPEYLTEVRHDEEKTSGNGYSGENSDRTTNELSV